GADADREEHRLVARLREPVPLAHEAGEGVEAVARIEERDGRLERGGMRALLQDRGALAVILADHDHRAADDAGRRDVRERVGRHVRTDDGFPGNGAAHRIVDRRAEQRRGSGLTARLLEVEYGRPSTIFFAYASPTPGSALS